MSKNTQRVLMAIGWLVIAVFTVNAIAVDGVSLLYRGWTDSASSFLIINDFLIELILIAVFIHIDSRRRGRNPWGWIVLTMVLGAIGSLGYLLARGFDETAPPIFGGTTSTAAAQTKTPPGA